MQNDDEPTGPIGPDEHDQPRGSGELVPMRGRGDAAGGFTMPPGSHNRSRGGHNSDTRAGDGGRPGADEHVNDGAAGPGAAGSIPPEPNHTAHILEQLAYGSITGSLDLNSAKTAGSLFKAADGIRHRARVAESARARAQAADRSGQHGGTVHPGGDDGQGQPKPGKPRMVTAHIMDGILDVAFESPSGTRAKLLRIVEPALDEDQRACVGEFIRQWAQRDESPDDAESLGDDGGPAEDH